MSQLAAAVHSLVAAHDALAEARAQLAAASRPGDFASLRAHAEPEVADAFDSQPRELRGKRVVGSAITTRRRGGVDTGEPALAVYVTRKVTPRTLARSGEALLPRSVTLHGREVPVDVVEFGKLERLVACGSSLGITRESRRSSGTLGVIARDNVTQAPVALTAMHVFDRLGYRKGDEVEVFCPRHGDDGSTALGRFEGGTMKRVDAARVSFLDPSAAQPFIKGIGPIRGWRPLVDPLDRNIPVRMFGARTGFQKGTIDTVEARLDEADLVPCLFAKIDGDEGDSGAALVDDDGFVLGILVGRSISLGVRVFSPIGLVLSMMGCDF
jgi:hypothetical protein